VLQEYGTRGGPADLPLVLLGLRPAAEDPFEPQWLMDMVQHGLIDGVCPSQDFRVCFGFHKSRFVALGDPSRRSDSTVTLEVRETVVDPAACRAGQTMWGGSAQQVRLRQLEAAWQVLDIQLAMSASGDCALSAQSSVETDGPIVIAAAQYLGTLVGSFGVQFDPRAMCVGHDARGGYGCAMIQAHRAWVARDSATNHAIGVALGGAVEGPIHDAFQCDEMRRCRIDGGATWVVALSVPTRHEDGTVSVTVLMRTVHNRRVGGSNRSLILRREPDGWQVVDDQIRFYL
jgi:hypothetical protein